MKYFQIVRRTNCTYNISSIRQMSLIYILDISDSKQNWLILHLIYVGINQTSIKPLISFRLAGKHICTQDRAKFLSLCPFFFLRNGFQAHLIWLTFAFAWCVTENDTHIDSKDNFMMMMVSMMLMMVVMWMMMILETVPHTKQETTWIDF